MNRGVVLKLRLDRLFAAAFVFWTAGALSAGQLVVQVVDAGNGQAIQGAVFRVIIDGVDREFETGPNGVAVLGDIQPGAYRIRIEKEGYIDPLDLEDEGRALQLLSPGAASHTVIALARAAAISGEITSAEGRALRGMNVYAVRRIEKDGKNSFTTVGLPAFTDDLGRFRLDRLPSGSYTVATVPAAAVSMSRGLGVAYFPGKRDISQAEFLQIGEGGEIGPIRIPVAPSRTGRIAGIVTGIPQDWPAPVAALALTPRTGIGTPIAAAMTDRSGHFTFESIPEGEYHILAWGPVSGADLTARPNIDEARFAAQRIAVTEGDSGEAHLTLASAIHLNVRTPSTACTGTCQLEVRVDPWPGSWVYTGQRDAGDFSLKGLPPGEFRFEMPGLDPICSFQGVGRADANAAPERVVLVTAPGQLTASITAGSSTVIGRFLLEDVEARFQHAGLWNPRERRFTGVVRTAGNGAFRFERVPAGRYRVIPLAQPVPFKWNSIEFEVGEGQSIHTELTVLREQ